MRHYGRHKIMIDESNVTRANVVEQLHKTLPYHEDNKSDIQYLWNYYKGKQPILNRVKDVRPEINNKIVVNRANQIVSFGSDYLLGEPIQYVSRSADDLLDEINLLNSYVFEEEKASKDKELADWMEICGVGYRIVLPDNTGEEDECPFEIYTLDPRFCYVVYHNGIGNKPVMGVKYIVNEDGTRTFSVYTNDTYFEINEQNLLIEQPHLLGDIPIIEYPLNSARLGAFEIVLPLLDAINNVESNRIDGLEQFVQSLMLFHNVDISTEDFEKLRELGALKFKDIDPAMRGDVDYISSTLNQSETQTLANSLYQTVLTICGMPSQADGNTSDSSNNGAVILRNGWQSAEAKAKNSELMFKKSERKFLKIALRICKIFGTLDIKANQIEIRFTRRNYENIWQKAQVLDLLLKNPDVANKLAFEHCGIFPDSDLAYALSKEEAEENARKLQEQLALQQKTFTENSVNNKNSVNNDGNDT